MEKKKTLKQALLYVIIIYRYGSPSFFIESGTLS